MNSGFVLKGYQKQENGSIMLECLVALCCLTVIIGGTIPLYQLVARQEQGYTLAQIQTVLPILVDDLQVMTTCAQRGTGLYMTKVNEYGVIVDKVYYKWGDKQLIRQKNNGFERVASGFDGVFQVTETDVNIEIVTTSKKYQLKMKR